MPRLLRLLRRTTSAVSSAFAVAALGVSTGCGSGSNGSAQTFAREATIRGELEVTRGTRGSAWLFLYPPGAGFPLTQAFPEQVTAVSDVRLREGDTRFLFADVPPNTYRLWGFLDTNLDFDPDIDVLGGPGAGDRVARGVELNVEPGAELQVPLEVADHLRHEPPAFIVQGDDGRPADGALIELPASFSGVQRLELRADALGLLDPMRTGFAVSLPDDPEADPTQLFPQLYLRFLRKPGQVVPLDSQGNPAEVIVPLLFDPGPYLALLAQDRTREVMVDRLTVFVLPQPQAITFEPRAGRVVTALDAIPVGDYELWVVSESGQFWRVPNDLGTEAAAHLGGPFVSQTTRFRFSR